jgi:tRNA (Thr-GGU) A37 N-methylase
MFTSKPIGFVSSPYKDGSEIPKGLGVKHEAEGVLNILPEFEKGLTDIEGFSHLFVIWEFDGLMGLNCLVHLRSRTGRMVCSRLDRRDGQIRLA